MGSAVDRLRSKVYGAEEKRDTKENRTSAVDRLKDIVYNGAEYTANPENSYASRAARGGESATPVLKAEKEDAPNVFERIGNVLTGAGKSTASDFTNLGGTVTEGLGRVGSRLQDKKDARLAAQDQAYLEQARKDLAAAQAADIGERNSKRQKHLKKP